MSIPYAEVAHDLDAASAEMQAAEAHGCLCGALCAVDDYHFDQWLAELSPDMARADALRLPGSPLRLLFVALLVAALVGLKLTGDAAH